MKAQQTRHEERAAHTYADLERATAREIERIAVALDHAEACSSLWRAVIECAVADYQWLQSNDGQRLGRYRTSRRRAILEHDPAEFLASPKFDAVCRLVGLVPDAVLSAHGLDRPLLDQGEAA